MASKIEELPLKSEPSTDTKTYDTRLLLKEVSESSSHTCCLHKCQAKMEQVGLQSQIWEGMGCVGIIPIEVMIKFLVLNIKIDFY